MKLFRSVAVALAASLALANPVLAQVGPQLGPNATVLDRMVFSGNKPTTVTCTIADGATNTQGRVTAVGVTTCTITFVAAFGQAAAWAFAPVCFVQDETAVRAAMTVATTTTTLVVAAVTSGDIFTYFCVGRT